MDFNLSQIKLNSYAGFRLEAVPCKRACLQISCYTNMKQIFTLFILIGLCPISLGCIISPYKMTAMNTENLRDLSDVIFFGKLVELKTNENGKQLAKFFVIKSIKGELEGRVEIRNEDLSSCFRGFQALDSAYYIFATKSQFPGQYEVTNSSSNGFIPFEWAVNQKWEFN